MEKKTQETQLSLDDATKLVASWGDDTLFVKKNKTGYSVNGANERYKEGETPMRKFVLNNVTVFYTGGKPTKVVGFGQEDISMMDNINESMEEESPTSEPQGGEGDKPGDSTLMGKIGNILKLYLLVCRILSLNDNEMRVPGNEFNVMKAYKKLRGKVPEGAGNRRQADELMIPIWNPDKGNHREVKMTRDQAVSMYESFLAFEDKNPDVDAEKDRRRKTQTALAMYDLYLTNYQNCFFASSKKVGEELPRICTPLCTGVTASAGLIGTILRNIGVGALIHSIMKMVKQERLEPAQKDRAVKGRLGALIGACVIEEQRAVVRAYMDGWTVDPKNKTFFTSMKALCLSFISTGSRQEYKMFPPMSMCAAVGGVPSSLNGIGFLTWWNASVSKVIGVGKNKECAKGMLQAMTMAATNTIFEDMRLLSGALQFKVLSRDELYRSGMATPNPEETKETMKGSGWVFTYFFALTADAGGYSGSGKGQCFSVGNVRVEHTNQADMDRIAEAMKNILGAASVMTNRRDAEVDLGSLMQASYEALQKRTVIFEGKKYMDATGKPVEVEIPEMDNPFYWGATGNDEPSPPMAQKRKPTGLFGGDQKRSRQLI